jgi:uncharacterized phiE125 gp8 family phage protein
MRLAPALFVNCRERIILMSAILITAPADEPLSLSEARAFLRVEHEDDDAVIAALIGAARLQVEAQTRRALLSQGWRLVRDAWPASGRIAVMPAPLQAVTAARIYDDAGVAQDIDPQGFVVDAARSSLSFPPWSFAAPGRASAGIEIDVTIGYGDDASDVPEPLRQAIRMLVAHWYDHRGVVAAEGRALPQGVAALIASYRMVSL